MSNKRILGSLAGSACALIFAAVLSRAQSSEANQGSVAPRVVNSPLLKELPAITPDELRRLERALEQSHASMITPVDPTVSPENIKPTNPETVASVPPTAAKKTAGPADPGTFTLFQNTALSVPNTLATSIRNEPSLGDNGRVLFWTGNWYAAVSDDRGQTFSYINPKTNFPPVNGGFCCDQVVYFERTRGALFWLLQYQPDNATNTYRLAVAVGQADLLNNKWLYYDFTPATFGFINPPPGASGFWLDFPDLAVSDNFLYITANVFPRVPSNPQNPCAGTCPAGTCPAQCGGNCTNTCSSRGAVIARLPLDQLAHGQQLNFSYYSDTNSTYRCTQGAHATMYWGSHNSTSQIRIYRWDETSTQNPLSDNINHAAYLNGTMIAPGPDGQDWAGQADDRILGAWVANGTIGFMWNAAQGGGFAYPHVEVVRFKETDRSLLSQGQVWSNSYAYLYPSVHPNDNGDLGGTMAWGGGTGNYPNALAWIADSFNGGTITPLENVTFAAGNSGPGTNGWGDFLTSRVNVPYSNTWVGSGYVLSGGSGNANVVPQFVWFGRGQDAPPLTNTIFVGSENTSGWEDGSILHPYSTVTRGNFAAMPGDSLLIGLGTYPEIVTFRTRVTVNGFLGPVTIGR